MADISPDLARRELLLAIADDELITGHRASHWTGVAPAIEEDLAFSTIAQDEINHADVWYQVLVAGRSGDASREEVDALGLGREADGYRHAVLCERPPRDFAYTLARHWCYDHADAVRLASLADSSDPDIAAVAAKLLHEERYHLEHADLWFRRLVGVERRSEHGVERRSEHGVERRSEHGVERRSEHGADDDARGRFRDALADVLGEAVGLFEPPVGEAVAIESGVLPEPFAAHFTRWAEGVMAALDTAGLGDVAPTAVRTGDLGGALATPGGRHGVHTVDFTEDIWPEMTHLYRTYPGASW